MANKQSHKERATSQRRGQILKAAAEVFTGKGYSAATIPEIARAAGVAAGTIYLYFSNKRELFVAVVKDIILTTPLLNLIEKIPTGNIEDVFKHILLDRFNLIKHDGMNRMPCLIGEVQRDPELKALWLKDFLQPFLSRMQMGYGMMSASGKIRRLEPAVTARAIGGMVIGFMILRVMEGESSPLNKLPPEKVAENIVDLVLHGLLNDTEKTRNSKDGTL